MTPPPAKSAGRYKGQHALVTGGLGFLGSALVRNLVAEGAEVRVLDSLLPQSGGNPRNIADLTTTVDVVVEDIRNRDAVNRAVCGVDVVFHLAGAAGPDHAASNFYDDLDINCLGTWHLVESLRLNAPKARLVFASTYHVYAPNLPLPVSEQAATDPVTRFGAHKLTAEKYVGALGGISARLASVFGPRQRLQGAGHGTLTRSLESALYGDDIPVYGDGNQTLDLLYVDDAVTALVALGAAQSLPHRVVNVGSGVGVSARAIAEAVSKAVGRGQVRDVKKPADSADTHSFVADVTRLRGLGVPTPTRTLPDALVATVTWYRGNSVAL